MGGLEPEINQVNTVGPDQQRLRKSVSEQLLNLVGGYGPEQYRAGHTALMDLLAGTPTDSSRIESHMLRQFDREIAPRINEGFAGISGSLSSRRNTTTANALGDLQGQIGALQVGLTESARNRQLQALGAALAPLGLAAQFSTTPTLESMASESPGSRIFRYGHEGALTAMTSWGGKGSPASSPGPGYTFGQGPRR